MRIVSNWPKNKDFHNDWGAAQKNGLKQPIAIGVVLVDQISGLLLRFFREGYFGGGLSIKYIGLTLPGIPSLLVENRQGMHDVVTHLIQKHGCRRIAYLHGPGDTPEAFFAIDADQVTAREYCNLHGLWKKG